MTLEDIKYIFKECIGNDEIEKVFDLINDYIEKKNKRYNEFLSLKSRWIKNKKISRRRTESISNLREESNQIEASLLECIDELEVKHIKSQYLGKEAQKEEMVLAEIEDESELRHKIFREESPIKRESIKNITFSYCDFNQCRFEGILFEKVKFIECTFNEVVFSNVSLYKVEMIDCILDASFEENFLFNNSSFYKSNLTNASFSKGKIIETDFTDTTLIAITMDEEVDILRPNFTNANLSDSTILSADLSSLDFFVCKSLENTRLPNVLAIEIAKSRHGENLFLEHQLKLYYPDDPVVLRQEEEDAANEKNEIVKDKNEVQEMREKIVNEKEIAKSKKETKKAGLFLK